MAQIKYIGLCVSAFMLAVALDVGGVVLLFVGIFANLRLDGRFYGDFLIYTGSLLIFSSLASWIIWYIGNVQLDEDDDGKKKKKRSSIVQLARKLSERLSQKLKPRVKYVEDGEECSSSQVSSPADAAHKASRVTWGRSTAYHNEGYDDCLDSVEKNMELEPEDKPEI
ncbi:transmembrane protein 238 [Sebastes fasciatus]|uniref:transmembrane protein 238 n=1 Tax=Sebastes fasciatus TaxID=394691 RepID=UPI003D9F10F5